VLQDGEVDIVVATYTVTCPRKVGVYFSGVYLEPVMRILVPADSGFETILDMAGRRVCVSTGSTGESKMRRLAEEVVAGEAGKKWNDLAEKERNTSPSELPRPSLIRRVRISDCLVALQRGESDAIVSDDVILAGFRAQDPYTEILGEDALLGAFNRQELSESYGVATHKARCDEQADDACREETARDKNFIAFVNGVLRDYMKTADNPAILDREGWAASYDHWLGAALGKPPEPPLNPQCPSWPSVEHCPGFAGG
jgi:polar amino acid transport system substrate-binding protein